MVCLWIPCYSCASVGAALTSQSLLTQYSKCRNLAFSIAAPARGSVLVQATLRNPHAAKSIYTRRSPTQISQRRESRDSAPRSGARSREQGPQASPCGCILEDRNAWVRHASSVDPDEIARWTAAKPAPGFCGFCGFSFRCRTIAELPGFSEALHAYIHRQVFANAGHPSTQVTGIFGLSKLKQKHHG